MPGCSMLCCAVLSCMKACCTYVHRQDFLLEIQAIYNIPDWHITIKDRQVNFVIHCEAVIVPRAKETGVVTGYSLICASTCLKVQHMVHAASTCEKACRAGRLPSRLHVKTAPPSEPTRHPPVWGWKPWGGSAMQVPPHNTNLRVSGCCHISSNLLTTFMV